MKKLDILDITKRRIARAKSTAKKTNLSNFNENYKKMKLWTHKFYFFWSLFKRIGEKPNRKLAFLVHSHYMKNKGSMKMPDVMLEILDLKGEEMMLRCRLY